MDLASQPDAVNPFSQVDRIAGSAQIAAEAVTKGVSAYLIFNITTRRAKSLRPRNNTAISVTSLCNPPLVRTDV